MSEPEKPAVAILCGGQGTRLREETEYRPKPLVEVGGRPILWHIMKIYAHHGFTDFVLALGYRGAMIKEYFLNFEVMSNDFSLTLGERDRVELHAGYAERGWRITFVDTGIDAQTGCRLARLAPYLKGREFMLTYGDGVSGVDIGGLLEFHRSHGRIATVTGVRPRSRFGELVEDRGRVVDFLEKPQMSEGFINGGFFVFDRRVLDYVSATDESLILERDPLEKLVKDGELRLWQHEAPWYCMDTYRDYLMLEGLWKSGRAEWKVWD